MIVGPELLLLLVLAPRQEASFVFRDATAEAGLVEPLAGMMGHGGAWGDVDADGRIDLFVGGFCDRPAAEYRPADGPVATRLFRNLGDGRFARTQQVEFHGRTSGAVFADLDNDGDPDLYVANNAVTKGRGAEPQRSAGVRRCNLFRNDAGALTDVSAASGACPESLLTARNVGVFDYDGDGLLDLLVLEDRLRTRAARSLLLRNLGGLKFEIANKKAGLPDDLCGLGLAVADLNGDHRPDFFVGLSNRLFLSQGGGTYLEATEQRALFDWRPVDGEDWPCGVAFGDLNRDGLPDLVITGHHQPARVRLYVGEGGGRFRDATKECGLDVSIPTKAPHVEIQDFDNDGWPDIYASAAWLDDGTPVPLIWFSEGTMRFRAARPVKAPMVYYPAGPTADYDSDGRLDIFLVNWFAGRRSTLLHNESPKRSWLDIQVVGKTVNRMGIGAKVRLMKSGRLLGSQEIATGYGYASGQRAVAHFGLGDAAAVDVDVVLPNGKKLAKENVAANQFMTIEEP